MKKVLTFIFIFFIFISNVGASTQTYERNEQNNYGVNKKWKITDKNRYNVLNTPYVDASEKIYDFSDILTAKEEKELYELMEEFIDHTGMDMVFVSESLPWSSEATNENYAADFYDYNDFGLNSKHYDGVILFRNTYSSDRYYGAYFFGETQLYVDQTREDKVLDDIYSYFTSDNYYDGIKLFIKEMTNFYDRGVVDKSEYIDSNGFVRVKTSARFGKALVTAIPFSLIATVIIILILVSKNKMVKVAYNAGAYLNTDSVSYTDKRDVFVSTHTTSYTHSSSSGGSSGGGGSRSSSGSSGGGHSGGGRRG